MNPKIERPCTSEIRQNARKKIALIRRRLYEGDESMGDLFPALESDPEALELVKRIHEAIEAADNQLYCLSEYHL